jgi:hypothetical protein
MARIQQTVSAPDYGGDTFTQSAFDKQVGKSLPVTIDGVYYGDGALVRAKISEDGGTAVLTFDVGDTLDDVLHPEVGGMSFGFNP